MVRLKGYPFRVSEFKRSLLSGLAPDERIGMNVFEEVVFYEIERRKLERSISMEVIERLSGLGASSASYDGFAKATSSTKETVRKHLDAFGDAFLLATYSSFDLARRRGAPKKERKFCWTDPALRYFVEHLGRGHAVDDAVVAEWLVGAELCRRHESRLHEGLSALSSVYTWKSAAGKEIDFLVQDRSSGKPVCHPFEVKYQSSVSEWGWKVMLKSFGRGTLVTKHPLGMVAPDGIRVLDLESFLRRSGA